MDGSHSGLKRRAPRLPIRLPGTLKARSLRPVTVVDLSLSGCLVQCPAPLDPGSIHDLSFGLGGDPFAAKARVTESSKDGAAEGGEGRYLVGLHFLGLPPREESQLRRFIEDERRRRRTEG